MAPRSRILYERIHSDVCGPLKIPAIGGYIHYLILTEESTRTPDIYLMKSKREVVDHVKHYFQKIENKREKILRFRSDNGTEFAPLRPFFYERGVIWETSSAYSQQSNGISERMIRTHNTKALCWIIDANVPALFWGDAIMTANHVHRITPQNHLDWKTPYELMEGKTSVYQHLKVFGCLAYRWLAPPQRPKENGK